MKYITFRQIVTLPLFTPQDLRNLGLQLHPNELTRWGKLGYLTKLRGGLYGFTDNLKTLSPHIIASRLVTPSYLSLSTALSLHSIIPEAVFSYTSITTKATRSYTLPAGTFTYQHLPPHLFFGYTPIKDSLLPYYLAEPEKALLDFFYLTPSIKNAADLAELRLNPENLSWDKLKSYLPIFRNQRLDHLVKILEKDYAHPQSD